LSTAWIGISIARNSIANDVDAHLDFADVAVTDIPTHDPTYTDAGVETYNIKNTDLAKKYLAQSGYKGEQVVLLTDKDYPAMYNSSLVMQQQMQAIGINAQLKVVDWPTSANMALHADAGWNFFYTGWGTQPALGALATMQFFVQPGAVLNCLSVTCLRVEFSAS